MGIDENLKNLPTNIKGGVGRTTVPVLGTTTTGSVIGLAIGGPIGSVVGGAVGAVVGAALLLAGIKKPGAQGGKK
jgi:hypothetical protein